MHTLALAIFLLGTASVLLGAIFDNTWLVSGGLIAAIGIVLITAIQ